MPTSRTDSGFTLFEVLIALALVAAVYLLVVPALGPWLIGVSPGEEARRLASVLREAQASAVATSGETAVVIDRDGRAWASGDRGRQLARGTSFSAVELPAGARLADGRAAIRFFPDGSSTGGRVEVAAAGRRSTVVVDWLTGRVRSDAR